MFCVCFPLQIAWFLEGRAKLYHERGWRASPGEHDPWGWGTRDANWIVSSFALLCLLKDFAFSALFLSLLAFKEEFYFGFLGFCDVESKGDGDRKDCGPHAPFLVFEKCE